MKKFVVYEKLSKKKQMALAKENRKTWGNIKPITKVKPSGKVYSRKRKQGLENQYIF